MNRDEHRMRLAERREPWDMLVIGGGATGLGIAVDAASRGYDILLVEQSDFAKGTSSRSTKLVHGGVRYLQQGNVSLVMEALRERGILRRNAPHLVRDLPFIVPNYEWWESPFYGIGLKVYDMLAGKYGFGRSRHVSKTETIERIPTIETDGLRGGTIYHDGQFDDARLAINLAQTAAEQGAVILNYARVDKLVHDSNGYITGAEIIDEETGDLIQTAAKVVINATGPFSDAVRRLDDAQADPIIEPSQGIHIVLESSFLQGDTAIMVPRTRDNRVMFAIPWHDRVVVGTTDTPIGSVDLEPKPRAEEIAFILETVGRYLRRQPTHSDILSVFAGIRPLVREPGKGSTSALSRDHSVLISPSGLITIAGGKWTTYRRMAKDTVSQAAELAGLDHVKCVTEELLIHGAGQAHSEGLALYGADGKSVQSAIDASADGAEPVHPGLPLRLGEVDFFVDHEMARTVDDVLSRRSRCIIFNSRASRDAAPRVAERMARRLHRSDAWVQDQVEAFGQIAQRHTPA
jgi:glycerol-3-phosphate dehydrogenase